MPSVWCRRFWCRPVFLILCFVIFCLGGWASVSIVFVFGLEILGVLVVSFFFVFVWGDVVLLKRFCFRCWGNLLELRMINVGLVLKYFVCFGGFL